MKEEDEHENINGDEYLDINNNEVQHINYATDFTSIFETDGHEEMGAFYHQTINPETASKTRYQPYSLANISFNLIFCNAIESFEEYKAADTPNIYEDNTSLEQIRRTIEPNKSKIKMKNELIILLTKQETTLNDEFDSEDLPNSSENYKSIVSADSVIIENQYISCTSLIKPDILYFPNSEAESESFIKVKSLNYFMPELETPNKNFQEAYLSDGVKQSRNQLYYFPKCRDIDVRCEEAIDADFTYKVKEEIAEEILIPRKQYAKISRVRTQLQSMTLESEFIQSEQTSIMDVASYFNPEEVWLKSSKTPRVHYDTAKIVCAHILEIVTCAFCEKIFTDKESSNDHMFAVHKLR